MAFMRTPSGLSNLAKFYGVDFIVFTEGGNTSYSLEDVCNGEFNNSSIDIKFWESVFIKHKLNKKVEFRAIGSKSSSNEICKLIEKDEIKNILVTRDSDLDDFFGLKYRSPYILYTQGYSFENDIYHKELIIEQIECLCSSGETLKRIIGMVDRCYEKFERIAPRLLKIELIFRSNGINLITDCCGERFISANILPEFKINQLVALVKIKKQMLNRPVYLNVGNRELCPVKFTYGKLVESLATAILTYVCKKIIGISAIPKDVLKLFLIDKYKNRIGHSEDQYYKYQIDSIITA